MELPFRKVIITLLLPVIFSSALSAKHIIGGVVTYTCNGSGNYSFVMKMYRDCNCVDCADFDSPAPIAIYRGNSAPYDLIDVLNISLDGNPINISPPDYPCLIPPDICVEQGTYSWNMTLPVSNESYHIVYQRCCRNVTISNIYDPDNSGATFSVEITPLAQSLCNDSPTFTGFPPTVICVGEPLNYDHSATDPDGDQLVYEFCSPLLGGGIDGGPDNPGGNASSCTGIAPSPPCAPPFFPVNFVLPAYSPAYPLAGNPPVTINPTTGLITGTPTTQGQFVVGVCISEYRNGQLLSVIRRDFQFNVASCTPTVVATIDADSVAAGNRFIINDCGDYSVALDNQSYQQQFIDEYSWTFDINGTPQTATAWDPTIDFPGPGQYMGALFLNPGTGCADTAFITINLFEAPIADFVYVYDTCVAGPVSFTDQSQPLGAPLTSWGWDFDDGDISGDESPLHIFNAPGIRNVTLHIIDENGCEADTTKEIVWFPVPPLLVVEPSSFTGCVPATVFFNNLSFPIDSTYTIHWDFGDGGSSGDISPTHIFDSAGIYTVYLEVTSPIGCYIDETWPNWIQVDPSPTAGFSYTPVELNTFHKTVTFTDESIGAVSWLWDFNHEGASVLPDPQFTFQDTGVHFVQQIVTHASGCMDTLIQYLDIVPIVTYYLPNAFTPNNDDVNDFFLGTGYFVGLHDFEMTIWNRWGELIFETEDPREGWNGRKNNTGDLGPNGVYVCVVHYTGPRGQMIELTGYATLIR